VLHKKYGSTWRGNSRQAPDQSWIIAAVVSLAAFMEVLDTAIANVALPYMAGGLAASVDDASWVLTFYLIASAVVLPISGWLSIRFGRKRFYMTCVVIFTVSSFLWGCAIARDVDPVSRYPGRWWRGLQPVSQTILRDTFPPEQLGTAFAVYGMVVVAAPAIGPTAGGWITDNYQWRWIFHMNVPVEMLSLLPVSQLIEDPAYLRKQMKKVRRYLSIDYVGIGPLALCLGSLQVVLDKGPGRRLAPFVNDCNAGGDLSHGARTIHRLGVGSLEASDGSADVQEPQLRSGCGNDFCLRSRGIRNYRIDSTIRTGVHGVQRRTGRFNASLGLGRGQRKHLLQELELCENLHTTHLD
jgi:Major Facilitator Superfamily